MTPLEISGIVGVSLAGAYVVLSYAIKRHVDKQLEERYEREIRDRELRERYDARLVRERNIRLAKTYTTPRANTVQPKSTPVPSNSYNRCYDHDTPNYGTDPVSLTALYMSTRNNHDHTPSHSHVDCSNTHSSSSHSSSYDSSSYSSSDSGSSSCGGGGD